MSSIKEVAQRAGVSISTVSNVLNGTKHVSEDLTRRVLSAVAELKYQANPIAQSMKSSKSRTVGIISTDISGLFYPYVMKGLYTKFSQNNYNVNMFETDGMHDPFNSWKRVLEGVRHFVNYRVDGIVLTSIFPTSMEEFYAQQIKQIIDCEKRIDVVSVETDFSRYGIDSVFSDSFEGAKKAVEHLIKRGCRRIVHITGPIFTRVSVERLSGYRSAMAEAGLKIDDRQIANGDYSHLSGYQAAMEIMKQMPDFDGMFVANDQMALGAMRALKEAGRRIPEDVKVIGYDDVFIASSLEPSLSTIHVLKRTMGEKAADLLIRRMESEKVIEEPSAIELETQLVERRSTNPEAIDDWALSDW